MLRAATPTTPIAMMPTPTIAMVTTLTNTPRPSLPNSDPQNSSIGLQTASKPANQGTEPVRIVPKNTIVVSERVSVYMSAVASGSGERFTNKHEKAEKTVWIFFTLVSTVIVKTTKKDGFLLIRYCYKTLLFLLIYSFFFFLTNDKNEYFEEWSRIFS